VTEDLVALTDDLPAEETRELLQEMIRNRCVNDGTPASGHEHRNAALLQSYLEGSGVELQRYEPVEGRVSLVGRLEGTDPDAPTVGLMGHTDVVPVTPDRWSHDPFGGDLEDGYVWGRGAIDMLNLTSSMAVALRRLAAGPRPRASVVFLAVADEEAGGDLGAGWLTDHAWDDVACDVVLTESGGMLSDAGAGPRLTIASAEKGTSWRVLTVTGRSSHGSRPYLADNAVVTAAEVVTRLAGHRGGARITEQWRAWVAMQGFAPPVAAALLDPARLLDTIDEVLPRDARPLAHAMTHTTYSPNVVRGGTKTNVIPDEVTIELDVRTLPGVTDADVDAEMAGLLAGLEDRVTFHTTESRPASASPTDTPWWYLLTSIAREAHPEATPVSRMTAGGTDAYWFRRRGVDAYGAGLFSATVELGQYSAMFHGPDERVDVESLGLSAAYWREFVRRAADVPALAAAA
jgi:acetylornithine deacetylase/succinyl-diaminopimelate desuccinylase-like protein